MLPPVEYAEQYSLIPQWAIAVIVIGLASLLFVIVFGVGVVSFMFLYFSFKKNHHYKHIFQNLFNERNIFNRIQNIHFHF